MSKRCEVCRVDVEFGFHDCWGWLAEQVRRGDPLTMEQLEAMKQRDLAKDTAMRLAEEQLAKWMAVGSALDAALENTGVKR